MTNSEIFKTTLLLMACWSLISGCSGDPKEEKDTLFRDVAPETSGITFINQLEPDVDFNIIQYLYYYNGGGVAVGDLNNDGLPDIYFTANEGANALYFNQGGLRFEDVTAAAGVAGSSDWTTGATMADVNADGWLDIYVCGLGDYKGIKGQNQLFVNNRDGTFREAAAEFGLDFRGFGTQAAFFDYDGDGDLDCYLLNHSVHSTENYGTSDIRERPDTLAGDRLLQNNGGRYEDVSARAGIYSSRIGYGLGISTGDLNGDGCPDIYVSNDFHENDYLYYNNCDGTFREAVATSLGYTSTFSMGSDIADFDNDGRLDLISLDMKPADEVIQKRSVGADPYNIYDFKLQFGYYYQFPRNMLQWNRGNLFGKAAGFSEIGRLTGLDATDWSWAPLFCDLDGDGRKDLFISNGIWQRPNDLDYLKFISDQQIQNQASDQELAARMPAGTVSNFAFRNAGDLTFTDVTTEWGLSGEGCSNGSAYADLDGDGDLDLVLNNLNQPAAIFENRAAENEAFHFIKVRLQGPPGNPFGIGARIEVEAGGQNQVYELYTTRGFQSAVEPVATIGLGNATVVDRLTVRWPGGQYTEESDLAVDQAHTLSISGKEKAMAASAVTPPFFMSSAPSGSGLDFEHRENNVVDFNSDGLLPHMLSTQGPRMAVGDVNADGWDDLFICGARGQSGALYLQTGKGDFLLSDLATDAAREALDAAFFDADADGDLDLYIVNGGGEAFVLPKARQDELWLNDGAGNFTASPDALPMMDSDGACVVPLDFNGDGAMDLFIGTRSIPGFYGIAPDSYLLQNDGKGIFKDVTEEIAPDLRNVGMVTDACLVEKDNEKRLIVVGEWMPVSVFTMKDSQWEKEELPYSNGWWNTVLAADMDGDGDQDLLLGNLGLNADIRASREEPVELFVKDFDGNRKTDPVLTYYKQGKRYTYASLDELSEQLVSLRKRFNTYRQFAGVTFEQVFTRDQLEGALHLTAYTFSSAMAIDQGNGDFVLRDLPRETQVSPLNSFATGDLNGDSFVDVLAAGNFYESTPALGRYNASFGHFLRGQPDGGPEAVEPVRSGFIAPGPSRDVRIIDTPGGKIVVVARNNAPLLIFQLEPALDRSDF